MRTSLFRGYSQKRMPLGAYAALVGIYGAVFGTLGTILNRRRRLPRPEPFDFVLFGVATHKLARIVARDWVTSPFRAAFTEYQSPAPGGEVNEKPRGSGMRQAIGDLVSCPFCMGPWVAGALVSAFALNPAGARLAAMTFSSVSVSDFLHRTYDALGEKQKVLTSRVEALEEPAHSTHKADVRA